MSKCISIQAQVLSLKIFLYIALILCVLHILLVLTNHAIHTESKHSIILIIIIFHSLMLVQIHILFGLCFAKSWFKAAIPPMLVHSFSKLSVLCSLYKALVIVYTTYQYRFVDEKHHSTTIEESLSGTLQTEKKNLIILPRHL